MKKLFILSICSLCILSAAASSKNFSSKQTAIIYSKAIETLAEYRDLINEIGEQAVKDVEMAKSKKEKLLELFINRKVLIYNDLDPSHTLSEFYEAETYASNVILWYPDGMVIGLDLANAKVSSIKQHDKNIFSMDILLKKQINGNYMNKTQNDSEEELTFRVAFTSEGNSFDNFKIAGIRSPESENKTQDNKALKEVNSEQLSKAELQKIHTGLNAVLRDYINYLALIGDPEEYDEDKTFYREKFLNLFKNNEVAIYNDLMPKPDEAFYKPEKYIDAYAEYYPDGIKNLAINMDSAEYGAPVKDDKGRLSSYVYADKFFSGQFKGSDAYRNQTNLMVKISFEKKGNTYTDYKIESIDQEGYSYYDNNEEAEMPEIVIQPVTRVGLAISAFGGLGQNTLTDETLNNITFEDHQYSYDVQQNTTFHGGIDAQRFFNKNVGMKAGVQYSQYSTKYSLNGIFQDEEATLNFNNIPYYDVIDAAIDSTVNIKSISIPISGLYQYGKPGKIGIIAEGGINFTYNFQRTYNVSGDIKSGQYNPNPLDPAMDYLFEEELGHYFRTDLDETGDAAIKAISLELHFSAGVVIPIGYYNSVVVGPEIKYGITDLNDRTNYKDLFGEDVKTGKMNMYSFSLKISYIYKL